ncbi:hypothetical protein HYU92_04890 [Candidatus Curtissbacteria bacterium]|nr:hypothetical protein [Candidatus Curtissbacteria bacterium]
MGSQERLELPLGYLPTEGLTPQEDQDLVALLSKWTGGRISTPVFTELAGMIPQPIVEVVLFRKNGDTLETLLIPRPEDDIVWPGMYHTPGSALRAADYHREDHVPLNGAFERIQRDEFKAEFAHTPTFAGRLHRLGDRGPEVAEVYVAELPEGLATQPNHVWYAVEQLEQNPKFIQGQLGHVMIAAEHFNRMSN